MSSCNATDKIHWQVDPIIGTFSLHTIGWITSGLFAIIASTIAFYLLFRHATHYSHPPEQRHIIRIILMIPVYALISWLSYVWYWYALYWQVARDCYEAFVIATFFSLLCQYLEPTLHDQKIFFQQMAPKPWPWPANWCCGLLRTPRSGLTWFNIIYIGVYQYCFIEVATTIISMATEYTNVYCTDSDSIRYAHIWMIGITSIMVTVAMYFIIAFYLGVKTELAPYKPFLKLLSIKLVIFFSFWQGIVIDLLVTEGVIKTSNTVSYGDIYTGLNTFLICVEMTGFAILHLWSFPWQDYTIDGLNKREDLKGMTVTYYGFWTALGDALNPWDLVKAFARGMRWLFVGRRTRNTDRSGEHGFRLEEGQTQKQSNGEVELNNVRRHTNI